MLLVEHFNPSPPLCLGVWMILVPDATAVLRVAERPPEVLGELQAAAPGNRTIRARRHALVRKRLHYLNTGTNAHCVFRMIAPDMALLAALPDVKLLECTKAKSVTNAVADVVRPLRIVFAQVCGKAIASATRCASLAENGLSTVLKVYDRLPYVPFARHAAALHSASFSARVSSNGCLQPTKPRFISGD